MLMPGRQMNQGVNIPGATVTGNTVVNGYTVPVDLTVNSRTGTLPSEYVASGNVEFSGEFESTVSDEFVAYISDAGYAGTGNLGAGLSGSGGSYRYGFNGKENDNEVKGVSNQQDYGLRIYDPRVAKFLSLDPLTGDYPWYTPYQFAGNMPIKFIDLDGAEPADPGKYDGQGAKASVKDEGGNWVASTQNTVWVWANYSWKYKTAAITAGELSSMFPKATTENLKTLETTINLKGTDFGITSINALAHYLAQAGHETGKFTKNATTESGLYKLSTVETLWGTNSYLYKRVSKDPSILKSEEKFFNTAYSSESNPGLGNGNEDSGDGFRFRGRGYFQLTGRANYASFTSAYNRIFNASQDFTANPNPIATDRDIAIISSFWYFQTRTLPAINRGKSFESITQTINSGKAGLEDRRKIYNNALKIIFR